MKIQPTLIPSNPQHNPERPTRPREPDPHSQRTERGSEREEGVTGESQGREKTQPDQGTRPPLPTDREGFRVRGEGDLDELERGTGGRGWVGD
jgi:hypothetical protein